MIMQPENIRNQKVLVSALDWGMGHTTRLISIVKKLHLQQNIIYFAGTIEQAAIVTRECDAIVPLELNGYEIKLSSNRSTYLQLILQSRKFLSAVKAEKKWVTAICKKYEIDLVISDNRYGFYSDHLPSVLITHQLNLQVPLMRGAANRFLRAAVKKFTIIWIPDYDDHRLSGKLSDLEVKLPLKFIGPLCRFEKLDQLKKYYYVAIVSGPMPERNRFAKLLADFLVRQKKPCALVGSGSQFEGIDCFNHLNTDDLGILIQSAHWVISRAGYTTIMELYCLQVNAVLIPTPGQYEQEYLARLNYPKIVFKTEKWLLENE